MNGELFKTPITLTHKQLVEISYKWMVKNCGVGFAFKELKSMDEEIPDVIGFDSWQSILIECKVSRGDFLSDQKKPHRKKGMGCWRFYCCPKGLIKKEELPAKWGLIYVDSKGKARIEYDPRVKKIKRTCTTPWEYAIHPEGSYYVTERAEENRFEADTTAERRIMYTAIRRLFIKGYVKYIYDKQYKSNSTPLELLELNETDRSTINRHNHKTSS